MALTINLKLGSDGRARGLCCRGEGVFAVDFRHRDADGVELASMGLSREACEWVAGKYLPVILEGGRYYLIREYTPEGVSVEGSIRADIFPSRFGLNAYIKSATSGVSVRYLCTTCGRVNSGARCVCDGGRYCSNCNAPLTTEEEKERGLCAECARRYNETIWDYHHRPFLYKPRFTKPEKRAAVLHVGAEVEVGGNDGEMDRGSFAEDVNELLNKNPFSPFVEFENDGSIEEGVECITAATTWEDFAAKDWAGFYAAARMAGGEFSRVNGVHFHFDREYFEGEDALASIKLEALVYRYFEFFKKISGRRAGGFYYAHKKEAVKDFGTACVNASHREHSLAINTSNAATIELRFFGGRIKSAEDLLAVRDIAEALAKWAKKASIAAVIKAKPSAIIKYLHDARRVLAWCKKWVDDTTTERGGEEDLAAFIKALEVALCA